MDAVLRPKKRSRLFFARHGIDDRPGLAAEPKLCAPANGSTRAAKLNKPPLAKRRARTRLLGRRRETGFALLSVRPLHPRQPSLRSPASYFAKPIDQSRDPFVTEIVNRFRRRWQTIATHAMLDK